MEIESIFNMDGECKSAKYGWKGCESMEE